MSETPETKPISNSDSYGGTFSFQSNLLLGIVSGWAAHWTDDYGKETINLAGLDPGQMSAAIPFTTSSSNKDHWGFSATTTDGATYGCADKECGFEEEDAGGEVLLSALYEEGWFTIGMPVSSSCVGSYSLATSEIGEEQSSKK